MNSRKALALVVVTVILAIQQTYALKCWVCVGYNFPIEEQNDKWCLDPFNATTAPKSNLEECPVVCYKGVVTVEDAIAVTRGCSYNRQLCNHPDIKNNEHITHCSICETDGCNDATSFSPVILLVTISTVTSIIMRL